MRACRDFNVQQSPIIDYEYQGSLQLIIQVRPLSYDVKEQDAHALFVRSKGVNCSGASAS